MTTFKLFCTTMFTLLTFTGICTAQAAYDYPIKDPYAATIIGTPDAFKASLPKDIKVKDLKINIFPDRITPEVFWYQDKLKYSLASQKDIAPLIFVIAGTGAGHDSAKMKMLQKAFFGAGFHVISLSSPTHPNFIVTASTSMMPGNTADDALDLYRVMDRVFQRAKSKIKVSEFYLTGYSLGAAEAAFISKLDEDRKIFNFKKVLMINPPVSLYNSVVLLDNMLEKNIPGGMDNFGAYFDRTLNKFASFYNHHDALNFNDEFLYTMYNENHPSNDDMAALIGLSFRISSSNMLFTADVLNDTGFIVPKNLKLSSTSSLTNYSRVTGRQSFVDYVNKLLLPNLKVTHPNITRAQLVFNSSLFSIENYLRESDKIGLITNADDLILDKGEVAYLKSIFRTRAMIYPRGGHCGNMEYRDNVAYMINFFSK
jgi:predicted alpha/beta-fold hydrolase